MNMVALDPLPAEPLEALRVLAKSAAKIEDLRWQQMAAARDEGASWDQIGEALGISRQSAWEYFTRRAREWLTSNAARNSDLSESAAEELVLEEIAAVRKERSQR